MPCYVHLWNKDNQPANCVRCGILAAVPAQAEPCHHAFCPKPAFAAADHQPGCPQYQGPQCRIEAPVLDFRLDRPQARNHPGPEAGRCMDCRRIINPGQQIVSDGSSDYQAVYYSETCLLIATVGAAGYDQGLIHGQDLAIHRIAALIKAEPAAGPYTGTRKRCQSCDALLSEGEKGICRACAPSHARRPDLAAPSADRRP